MISTRIKTGWLAGVVTAVLSCLLPNAQAQPMEGDTQLLESTRISLSLQPMPLHEALGFLALAHDLKFGYGGVPDAVVSATFDDAPLLPALQALLNGTGYEMRLAATPTNDSGEHDKNTRIWLFRRTPDDLTPPASGVYSVFWTAQSTPPVQPQKPGSAWEVWSREFAPPPGWNLPAASTDQVQVQMGEYAHSTAGWGKTVLQVENILSVAASPAAQTASAAQTAPAWGDGMVAVLPPENWDSGQGDTYLRWQMPLRTVPRGTQLLLHLPQPATLSVNGAPLFRRRQGVQRIDLTRLLRLGPNSLALHFVEPLPAGHEPLLHYAWILPGKETAATTTK